MDGDRQIQASLHSVASLVENNSAGGIYVANKQQEAGFLSAVQQMRFQHT